VAFSSASGAALSREVPDGKMNDQTILPSEHPIFYYLYFITADDFNAWL
jgi:hypothetical protein